MEVNGDYWHSDKVIKEKNRGFNDGVAYHGAKLAAAEELDISLVFLWEHHWRVHGDVVRQALDTWINYGVISPLLRLLSSHLDVPCLLCND